jgi:hypothetical protein
MKCRLGGNSHARTDEMAEKVVRPTGLEPVTLSFEG